MFKKLFKKNAEEKTISINQIKLDKKLKVKRLKYKNYDQYIQHQGQKLEENYDDIVRSDKEYEKIVEKRFKKMKFKFKNKTMICLGARLGGEVRAFKNLGSLALGVDVNPGTKNEHVLYGDFHNLAFADKSFDYAFSNVIDHVYDVEKFSKEVARVLKKKGVLFLECAEVPLQEGRYEVIDTQDLKPIISQFEKDFHVKDSMEITNKGSWIDWSGQLYILVRK